LIFAGVLIFYVWCNLLQIRHLTVTWMTLSY